MADIDVQRLDTKRGEVEYRRKLASQQYADGPMHIPEAHDHDEILRIMRERVDATRETFQRLATSGIPVTPYVELGAERCQRALMLENELGARGIAIDISLDMLRYADVVARDLGYDSLPLRVCCDAYNLPLRDASATLVFCYQTLHHFPNPLPICQEAERVLRPKGVMYIDDEPVRGWVTRLTRLRHKRGIRQGRVDRVLERLRIGSLITKVDGLEREYGVLEEEFSLSVWERTLAPFSTIQMVVNRKLKIRLDSFRFGMRRMIAELAGGNLAALCVADKAEQRPAQSLDPLDALRCPSCKGDAPLAHASDRDAVMCPTCRAVYPTVDGVLLLFEQSVGRELYPEHFNARAVSVA